MFTNISAKVMTPAMSIVTKRGDGGKTRLYSGEEVSKASGRLEAYGTLDELVSFMGLARSFCPDEETAGTICKEQERLFRLGSELATTDHSKVSIQPIGTADTHEIEALISDIEKEIQLPKKFTIPGGNTASAALDVCRTVCRRLERLLVGLKEKGEWDNSAALISINRLSDLLFLLARKANLTAGRLL